jgi:hypothetical protein
MKILQLIIVLILSSVARINAQDIRDEFIGCYYCSVDRYLNNVYLTTFPSDTTCIEKNDTLSGCIDGLTLHTFTPGSVQYYHTEFVCAISDTTFTYYSQFGYLKALDSLYYIEGGGTSMPQHRYKCSRINSTTSILERIKNKSNILAYPQPANDVLYVSAVSGLIIESSTISLYDISGRLYDLPLTNIGNNTLQMDVKNLPPGMYILQLKTSDGIAVKKIIVARD